MTIFRVSRQGKAIGDLDVSDFVDTALNMKGRVDTFEISTWLVVDEIRARFKEGHLTDKDVRIDVFRESDEKYYHLRINKNGKMYWIPEEWMVCDSILDRLIM